MYKEFIYIVHYERNFFSNQNRNVNRIAQKMTEFWKTNVTGIFIIIHLAHGKVCGIKI